MKIRTIIFFSLVLFTIIWSGKLESQSLSQTQIHVQLNQSISFNEDIKAWYFTSHKEIPFVAIQGQKITWFNKDAQPLKVLDLPPNFLQFRVSRKRKFLAILNRENQMPNKVLKITVMSGEGQYKYEIKRSFYPDESLPMVAVSDQGQVVVGFNATGLLWFYKENGRLLKKITLFREASFDLERILELQWDEAGEKLAVLATKRGASPVDAGVSKPSGEPRVFLFTKNGKKLWERALQNFNAGTLAFSTNGDFLIASSYSIDLKGNMNRLTQIFDPNGKPLYRYEFLFREYAFSPEGKFALLADRFKAILIDLPTGELIWKKNLRDHQGIITAVELTPGAQMVLLLFARSTYNKGHFIFSHPHLVILNRLGKSISDLPLQGQYFYKPALDYMAEQTLITLGFKNSLFTYKINQ